MRVAFIMDWHLYYSTELANALAAEGHDVMLVARDHTNEISSPDRPMEVREFLGASLHDRIGRDIMCHGRLDPRGFLEMLRIYRRIKAFSPDVLHVQENSDWRIYLIARLIGYDKVVLTVHDVFWHPGEIRRKLSWWACNYLRKRAGRIIVHGEFLREQFSKTSPGFAGKTFSVHHGSYSIFRQWDDGTVKEEDSTVLFFGRLCMYKGLEQLIDAAPLVKAAVPEVRIIIAGNDFAWEEYFGALHDRVKDDPAFEVHNRFIPNEEVPRLFRKASVVVIPYLEASQSGVISVAFAFGKPVVATRVGALPEVMEDGGTGFLVPPGDHEALAEAIIKILKDPELRRSMAARAFEMSETDLSWGAAARKTVAEVYTSGTKAGERA